MNKKLIFLFLVLLLVPALAVARSVVQRSSGSIQAADGELASNYRREDEPWLTHDEAMLRSRTVGNIVYTLDINLTDAEVYTANITIKFDYQPSSFPLTLDFLDGQVESLIVGLETIPVVYNGNFITIAPGFLSRGQNIIKVAYSHAYSETGAGLYRFVDSSDQRVYLYTHFEPYDANRLAPMFDQPNLRARWLLTVRTPNDWQVVTTIREDSIEHGEDDATWHFPLSPSTSSYILPLHAGQYHVWEGMAGDIPLRLFARESLARYVRAEWLLELTSNGMAFFQAYFDEPYPFTKYDQLLVPDFNIGGMENIAAVTYTERSIPRGEPTRERMQGTAGLFLHEMAHMWFGDLVTIDWWNALWLKESFASLMGPLAIGKATEFDSPWLAFYLSSKQSAYQADQHVTTHPIEMPVRDTKSGNASFDAITYEKGASVLKQLNHFLGEDKFREGVRQYLSRYGWQAATLPDFMDTLAKVSGRDLQAWTRDWLQTAGVNTVKAEYECRGGTVASFRLRQTAPRGYPTLRHHRLQIGLFGLANGTVVQQKIVSVELHGAVMQVPELVGQACPVLVYPNVGDWAYIRVLLDRNSLQRVPELVNRIPDSLLRAMFWQSLWDAVIDQDAAVSDYLDVALKQLPGESDTTILQQLLNTLSTARQYLFLFGAEAGGLRMLYLPAIETMARQQTLASIAGSDRQKQWFDAWLRLAGSGESLKVIANWLAGESEPLSLNQDQDRRWQALLQLAANGYGGTDALIQSEMLRDSSDTGKMAMITIAAAWPDAAIKDRYLDAIKNIESEQTSAMLKASMLSMFPTGQEQIHQQFGARILSGLPALDKARDQDLIGVYVETILPALCTPESVSQLANSMNDRGTLGLIASKALRVSHQKDQRCLAMAARQFGGIRPESGK